MEDFEGREQVYNEMYCETLNEPITKDEINAAIKALKDQTAAGPDGLIGQFYKSSTIYIVPKVFIFSF